MIRDVKFERGGRRVRDTDRAVLLAVFCCQWRRRVPEMLINVSGADGELDLKGNRAGRPWKQTWRRILQFNSFGTPIAMFVINYENP